MPRTHLETVVPILILLFSTISCGPFLNPVKPTQAVDLSPMVGKPLAEMTSLLGEPKPSGICHAWDDLAEGRLHVCYRDGGSMKTLHYSFPPAPLFGPRTAVGSPEEMAELVKIDLQDRKPDVTIIAGYAYDNYTLNGKSVDLFFEGGPKTIVGVRVDIK